MPTHSLQSCLDGAQQQRIRHAVVTCLQRAEQLYNQRFVPIPVHFDLRGRSAGMYRVRNGNREIRFNPYIFSQDFDAALADVVPHEVAHYVTDLLHGRRRLRPHGREWKRVVVALGGVAKATGCFNLDAVPVRRERRIDYACDCMTHAITQRRHNAIRRGRVQYHCRQCGTRLQPLTP